jgi:peptidyl-prolyl cis-trans isomerase C
MTIRVNDAVIDDADIAAEAFNHASAPSPRHAAACALAIRELLLQRAGEIGIDRSSDAVDCDAVIESLLELEAQAPVPTEEECRKFYEQRRERFAVGELVEAAHILFAVTPNAPVDALRNQAESMLRQVLAEPHRFGEFAERFSNCPSGAQRGNLGQISRGEMVPEFERAIFGAATGILPRLVNTRYGFHIVHVNRYVSGHVIAFDTVKADIERELTQRVRTKAAEQYVRLLAGKATIAGIDLHASASALMQ